MRSRQTYKPLAIALAVFLLTIRPAAATPGCAAAGSSIAQLREQRDWYAALAAIERGLACTPGDRELLRLQVLTLADIGSNDAAWRKAQATPGLLDAGEMDLLASKRLARLVAWTEVGQDEPARVASAQQALQASDAALARMQGGDSAAGIRVRLDRLLLLNRLGRHAEVATEQAWLVQQGVKLPPYVLGATSDSLMALRRPAEAAALLSPLLVDTPDSAPMQVRHAFAELEMEHGQRAIEGLRRYAATQPPLRWDRQHRQRQRNWARYDADLARIQITAYTGDADSAQGDLEAMLRIAPGNGGLHSALAQTYMMRGWPRLALDRFRIAAMHDPQDLRASIGQVEALMALRHDDQAAPLHARLVQAYPASSRVAQLDRTWRRHRGWQWQATAGGGRSDGNAADAPLGSRDAEAAVELLSPLLGNHWRLLAGHADRHADLHGDRVRRRDTALGARYAHGAFDAALGWRQAGADARGHGLDLQLGWQAGDHWSLAAGYHRNAADVSLQAVQAGIGADRHDLGVAWRLDDHHVWRLSLDRLDYDDGNRRHSLLSRYEQRLADDGDWWLDGSAGAYASRASVADAAYFNPARDASLELGLQFTQRPWRVYDRHFQHRLELGLGRYWQQDYGAAWVPVARYQHEWRFAPGRYLRYGLSWARPVYDGARERRLGLDAGFYWEE